MSAYKFYNPEGIYFVTFTVVEWVDVFTRKSYSEIVLDSLKYCIKEKGLVVHAWCLMSNHIHLIISKKGEPTLSDIVRDFKKFTSSQIIKEIETNKRESRRNWILWVFNSVGAKNSNNKKYQFWRQDSHAEELFSHAFMDQKLNYIHCNPVEAGIVLEQEHYVYSSATDYAGGKGLLELEMLC